jgi:drug/metabolite transporter (DMT)-like permease
VTPPIPTGRGAGAAPKTTAPASAVAAPAGAAPARDPAGYAMVAVSFLIFGAIGALVRMAVMPESALIVARMVIAAAILSAIFVRRPMLAEVRAPRVGRLLLLNGVFSASCLLLFFTTLRLTDVSIGMFLLFMAPVYVALSAPRLLRQRPDRIVYPALAVALVGMATILLPRLVGTDKVSTPGIVCGVATGFLYAGYQLVTKKLTRTTGSVTIALGEMVVDALLLLPLAAWQVVDGAYRLTARDLVITIVLAVLCTAIPYVLYVEGMSRVRVEHASILGYLEPLSAPFYAFLLLSEAPAATTVAGGALIIVAGILVIAFGKPEQTVAEVPL